MSTAIGRRLEQYTQKRPGEVLLVSLEIDGEADQIAIFRGFSSSLMRATAYDPDVPMVPDGALVQAIDRLVGPYNPSQPRYLQQGLTWEEFVPLLEEVGV